MTIENESNFETDENLESDDPLNEYRTNSEETCFIPNIYNCETGILDIAPGEGKRPQAIFDDEYCEEQAFPYLFPTGRFGYNVSRQVKLSPVRYFNQRLLNYTQHFSSDSNYIFFAHCVLQQRSLFNQLK